MKRLTKVTTKQLFKNFDPHKSAKQYLKFIRDTKDLLNREQFLYIDIQNYLIKFKKNELFSDPLMKKKDAFLFATHLLQPNKFQKFTKDNQIQKTPNFYDLSNRLEFDHAITSDKVPGRVSRAMEDFHKEVLQQIRFNERLLKLSLNDDFIANAVDRYEKFLTLRMESPTLAVVPTLDIDFVWHSHMLNHQEYINDCEHLFGAILNHDTLASDIRLATNFQKTSNAWEYRFKQKYVENKEKKPNCLSCLSCGFGDLSLHQARERGELLNSIDVLEPTSGVDIVDSSICLSCASCVS